MGTVSGYCRALVKISGEALAGSRGFGLEAAKSRWIADQIVRAVKDGRELGLVVGGGNITRGIDAELLGVPRLVGDQMGMIATVINALALRSALEAAGAAAVVMSAFAVGTFVEPFHRERARAYIESGSIVLFAGGTGNPCFTTDTAAALRAVEIGAEVMVKGTQVRGVFDKDPRRYPDAAFFPTITAQEVLARRLGVIDAASVDILNRNGIPAIVLDLHKDGNLSSALAGQPVGTTIT